MSANLRLRLEREASDGVTRLHVDEQQPPLKVVRAFPMAHGETLVHLHNVSGGILAGDRLQLDISVGDSARAQITSTGATRIYRSPEPSLTASQHTAIRLGPGALLEFLPDPLIPFAQSRYSQQTRIELAAGAQLFWWDVLAPGRFSSGESFAYDSVQMGTEIRTAERQLVFENYRIEPSARSLDVSARFGPYTHLASFYACEAGRNAKSLLALENLLSEIACGLTAPDRIIWGVSLLASGGVAVRGLSATGLELAAHLREFWRASKRFLTGHEAVIPRKVL